jgi:hypothetical protein
MELTLAAQGLTGQLCSPFVDAERLAGSAYCPSEKIIPPIQRKVEQGRAVASLAA